MKGKKLLSIESRDSQEILKKMEYKKCIGSRSRSVELDSLNLMLFEEDKNEVYHSICPLSLQASNFRS